MPLGKFIAGWSEFGGYLEFGLRGQESQALIVLVIVFFGVGGRVHSLWVKD